MKKTAISKNIMAHSYLSRDISWLYFNERVLQEANDSNESLYNRIRFLGIFSNNLDEFFRVRVASLKRMASYTKSNNVVSGYTNVYYKGILNEIQEIVLAQQQQFEQIWKQILQELKQQKIFLLRETQLNKEQQHFISAYFDNEVRSNTIPLMLSHIPQFPYLREKSIYLAIVLSHSKQPSKRQYALIEVPTKQHGRFLLLPSKTGTSAVILLEDVIRYNLPNIFSYLDVDTFNAYIIKITKDAEIELDNEELVNYTTNIEKALKKRRTGKPVRFIYDKEIDAGVLTFLIKKLNLNNIDNITPGGRIHNFRHFMDFPKTLFPKRKLMPSPPAFTHPLLVNVKRVTDIVLVRDVLFHFPYHKFDSIIDMLREAAFDPLVTSIKICCYRLASYSKIINALINAARNGKAITVMLELRARFDEEANLEWKELLELDGIKVLTGFPDMKVHAKIALITKKVNKRNIKYGFISSGNINEKTAQVYSDVCLFTSNKKVMNDITHIFNFLEKPTKNFAALKKCKTLWVSPISMRQQLLAHILKEIQFAKKGKAAFIYFKVNACTDIEIIEALRQASNNGVDVRLIIRSAYTVKTNIKHITKEPRVISIVDAYLEHARHYIFSNNGKPKVYISSADIMRRNLDFRIEAACPIILSQQIERVIHIFNLQWNDNVKARSLQLHALNEYVSHNTTRKKIRSQQEIYTYLQHIKNNM
jgi:polyphosphate kinase